MNSRTQLLLCLHDGRRVLGFAMSAYGATDWTDSKEEKSQPATATIEYVHRSAMMRGRSVALVDGAAAADSVPPPGARGRGRGGRGRGRGGAGIGAKTPIIDRTTLVEMPEQRGRGRGFAHALGSGSATVVDQYAMITSLLRLRK